MAKSDLGTILGLGIAGVGAYWLWSSGTLSSLFGSTTAVATPAGGVIPASTPPPTTSGVVPAPVAQTPTAPGTPPPAPPFVSVSPGNATLATQIQSIAGAGPMNPDQWNFYYNQILTGRGGQPLTGVQFDGVLTALGLTTATRSNPITLAQFVAALGAQGLSGLQRTALHRRKVHYVSPARYAGGNYHPSGNTSPQGGF